MLHAPLMPPYLKRMELDRLIGSGVRLLMPCRPGFAESDPITFTALIADTVSDDLVAGLDMLRVGKFDLIGVRHASIWAMQFAARHPSLVQSLYLASVPVSLRQSGLLTSWTNIPVLRRVNLFSPGLLKPLLRLALHNYTVADRRTKAAMLTRIYPTNNADSDFFKDEANMDWVTSWTQQESERCHNGVSNDVLCQDGTEWLEAAASITCPVTLWHGALNTHNPTHLHEQLATQFPNATLIVDPDVGELGFYQNALELLLSYVP